MMKFRITSRAIHSRDHLIDFASMFNYKLQVLMLSTKDVRHDRTYMHIDESPH